MSAALYFNELPRTVESHFRLHFYGAILYLRSLLGEPEADDATAFLRVYYDELDAFEFPDGGAAASVRWQRMVAAWERGARGHLPIRALGLDATAMTLLLTAGLPEEDMRFGRLFEALNQIPGETRPTAGLLATWMPDARAAVHRLLADGLLASPNPQAPRPRQAVEPPAPLWDALRAGIAPATYTPPHALPQAHELVLPTEARRALARLPALLTNDRDEPRALIVRGPRGSGRHTLLGALARELSRGVLEIDALAPLTRPLATALDALPVLEVEPAPGETADIPPFAGTLGVIAPPRGGVRTEAEAIALTLGIPDPQDRAALWRKALGDDSHAGRLRLAAGTIRTVARRAQAEARLQGRAHATAEDVTSALGLQHAGALERLARRMHPAGTWGDLAVAPDTARELELLECRCRNRERLAATAPRTLGLTPGVRALLTGPSGTGKTLAARLLASALRKQLYVLDVATVVDKYLGETEKNLDAVLTKAEELDVVLLLDEGDALLTRRTDVQTSNDRYANLETNFLLQRLESYEGILLITTNAAERIDAAFKRRMDVVIEFRAPDPLERWQIWRAHLPADHRVSEAVLSDVAARCQLKGGEIRNAALHAALLALRDEQTVGDEQLETAVRREYDKAGLVCPLRPAEAIRG